jgi:predicted TIM-barrel fold metal-dependent hydrolase
MLVDTHLHMIERSRLSYPWLAGVPALNHDFRYAEYERDARRCGISGALHMEVDVAPADIEREIAFVEDMAARPGNLIRGAIAACRPEEPGFAALLERQVENPLVKGFRRLINPLPDEIASSRILLANIGLLAGTGLTFDLHVHGHQLRRAMLVADSAPAVQFVLDHCGVPDIKSGAMQPWRDGIAELAKRPNVMAKISGVVAYGDGDDWGVETLRPWVEHVIDSFGWDRVVWGSDWPVCTLGGGLLAWVAATHTLLSGCGNDERDSLLWRNADRVWELGLAAQSP